ncbi:MAG: trypsin-like serine protease [Cyanobacteria bacterium P01_D01_bin.6]
MSQYLKVQCEQNGQESFAAESVVNPNLPLASKTQTPSSQVSQKTSSVVSSKDTPTNEETTPAKSAAPGVEPLDGYEPVGETAAQGLESEGDFEAPFSLLDAYTTTREAQELTSSLMMDFFSRKSPESGGQERFGKRIGGRIRKWRNWWRGRPLVFESSQFESSNFSSNGGSSLLEVVNDVDDRVLVEDTTTAPWNGIVQLNILSVNGGKYVGTGCLIAPRTVLTAGHCVYMHDAGGFAQEITLSAGRNGDERPFGQQVSSNFSAPSSWINDANRSEDYAVIFLDKPFSPFAGEMPFTFSFAAKGDGELLGQVLNLSGYPAGNPLEGKDSTLQWFHARTPISVTPNTIVYDTDTSGGQSGSPCWHYNAETGERVVVGIHTNGFPYANSATRITPEMAALFEEWRQAGQ